MRYLTLAERWEREEKEGNMYFISKCNSCKHFHRVSKIVSCDAFPKGIPDEIFDGDHLTPYPGDNGIQFEKKN